MRRITSFAAVLSAGVALGWVLHQPPREREAGSIPETVRVSYPARLGQAGVWEPDVKLLDVRVATDPDDGERLATHPGATGRPWRFVVYWPGGRRTVWVAAERE